MGLVEGYVGFITTVCPQLFCFPAPSKTDSNQSAIRVRPQRCIQSVCVKIDADQCQKSPRISSITSQSVRYLHGDLKGIGEKIGRR